MNVRSEIENYISTNETNGALLITGKWGCGKTYLLKNIAREINGCFLNKTSHIMVFMHKNKRFMHKCIHMHKKKTRELYCIISDVTRREREQKTPD